LFFLFIFRINIFRRTYTAAALARGQFTMYFAIILSGEGALKIEIWPESSTCLILTTPPRQPKGAETTIIHRQRIRRRLIDTDK